MRQPIFNRLCSLWALGAEHGSPCAKQEGQRRSWSAGQRASLGSAGQLNDGRTTAVSCATVTDRKLQSRPGWTGWENSNEHETRAADSQTERTLSQSGCITRVLLLACGEDRLSKSWLGCHWELSICTSALELAAAEPCSWRLDGWKASGRYWDGPDEPLGRTGMDSCSRILPLHCSEMLGLQRSAMA